MGDELRLEQRAGGDLEGSIQWGGEEGSEPRLVHAITVPLAALRLGADAHARRPELRLHSIRFGVQSWRELEKRSFSFPNVVMELEAEGESHPVYDIYGSLELRSVYHQVLMSSIAFGEYDGLRIVASLAGTVKSVAKPPLFAPTDFTCEASLTVGPVDVRGDLGSTTVPTRAEAEEVAKRLLRLEDYAPPKGRKSGVRFQPCS